MQRCCARLAGIGRTACFGSRPPTSFLIAKDGIRQLSKAGRRAKRRYQSKIADSGESPVQFLSDSKLPARQNRNEHTAWLPFLEATLPARLRRSRGSGSDVGFDAATPALSPRELGMFLRRGQRQEKGLDLLTWLGVHQGRWKAVVWLVEYIVKHLWKEEKSDIQERLATPWSHVSSLTSTTSGVIELKPIISTHLEGPNAPSSVTSLDSLTAEASPLDEPLARRLRHEALGQVWQSLGNMIIEDATQKRASNAPITPEILEIIALLHHCGMMPGSIYTYQPSKDTTTLHQPPTLHLLSSYIMTSLTDAAWRARQSLVAAETDVKGYRSFKPDYPETPYRVNVAGLGFEVWLELVLWSCLYGGWTVQGANILASLNKLKGEDRWRVLSWRQVISPAIQANEEHTIDWDEVRYLFNTSASYGDPLERLKHKTKVTRTVSAEVVASFVDALLDDVRIGVGERGHRPGYLFDQILGLKTLLKQNNLSLGSTSWEAVILRFMESHGIDLENEPGLAERVVYLLSSEYGEDISVRNAPKRDEPWKLLPTYVLDGTAAIIGLMHRVLRAYIKLGNLDGARRVFGRLQALTDRNRERSIEEFFATRFAQAQPVSEPEAGINFESSYGGIEYPAFHPQMPVTLLAPFLDQITEAREFKFGDWLLLSDDIDGPLIPESMYSDPVIGPALIRYATAKQDRRTLVKVLEKQTSASDGPTQLPESTLLAFLDSQAQMKNWDSVEKILDIVRENPDYSPKESTLAALVRAVLREISPSDTLDWTRTQRSDLASALRTFSKLAQSQVNSRRDDPLYPKLRTILLLLTTLDKRWSAFCWKLMPLYGVQTYNLNNSTFRYILEGVTDSYGAQRGKQVLDIVWPIDLEATETHHSGLGGVATMPVDRPIDDHPNSNWTFRFEIEPPSDQRSQRSPRNPRSVLGGFFRPDVSIIRTILRKGLLEARKNGRDQIRGEFDWAATRLRVLGLRSHDVRFELEKTAKSLNLTTENSDFKVILDTIRGLILKDDEEAPRTDIERKGIE